MASFRFVHAADIHLDSPLTGLSGQGGATAQRIQTATRQAFHNLIDFVIKQEAAFLILAGDLYDGEWRDYQTGLFFIGEMGRLAAPRIPAYVLYGNHDAESKITTRLVLPSHVHAFPFKRPGTFLVDELDVALHGQSFKQPAITDNLVTAYPEPTPKYFNIGVLHTGLGGLGGHANYAPCALEQLVQKGYDYWALGHVHQHQILNERPHVVFPGNLQGRHIKEVGAKGACLVTVDDGAITQIETIPMDVVRWAKLSVFLEPDDTVARAVDRIQSALEAGIVNDADGRLLACRIELTGTCQHHGTIVAASDHLLAEARASAAGIGEEEAWVERILVRTTPMTDPAVLRDRQDALGELQRLLNEAPQDEGVRKQLDTDIGELVKKLPHPVRTQADGLLKAVIHGNYGELIEEASQGLTTQLSDTV